MYLQRSHGDSEGRSLRNFALADARLIFNSGEPPFSVCAKMAGIRRRISFAPRVTRLAVAGLTTPRRKPYALGRRSQLAWVANR